MSVLKPNINPPNVYTSMIWVIAVNSRSRFRPLHACRLDMCISLFLKFQPNKWAPCVNNVQSPGSLVGRVKLTHSNEPPNVYGNDSSSALHWFILVKCVCVLVCITKGTTRNMNLKWNKFLIQYRQRTEIKRQKRDWFPPHWVPVISLKKPPMISF